MSKQSQKNNEALQFMGPFKELIPKYISYKRAQGYQMGRPLVYRLREMDQFFLAQGTSEIRVTREMYDEWTQRKPGEKSGTTQKRVNTIRGFAKYLVFLGYKDIYTGEDDTRIFKRDFIPYVFSNAEIERIFRALESLCETDPCYESHTFRIVMLLYYCCGFRKSEVQNLRIKDIAWKTGIITILNGKNDVSRIVPVSNSLKEQLLLYQKCYLLESSEEDFFLYPNQKRNKVERIVYQKFHWLLKESGISARIDGGCQRLHDLRHTFCVRALEQMQEKGFDLYTSLPLLSTYLGHKHITETEYYLRMLEEHFDSILEKTALYNPDIFPKYQGGGGNYEAE